MNPTDHPEEVFDVWSVPGFPTGKPDVVRGNAIGSTKQIVQAGDVLLCKINPRINRVWIVRPQSDRRQIASTEWIVVRGGDIAPDFIKWAMTEPSFRKELLKDVTGVGGSLMRARPISVARIGVGIAPLNEQRRIVAKIEALMARQRPRQGSARRHPGPARPLPPVRPRRRLPRRPHRRLAHPPPQYGTGISASDAHLRRAAERVGKDRNREEGEGQVCTEPESAGPLPRAVRGE